jgi:hypothetical protein
MQGDSMKEKDVDKYLRQHLSGSPPRGAFKQQALRDSTIAFVRVQRRRSAWRRAEFAAAAVLIAGIAFVGGRLSMPRKLPRSMDIEPQVAAEPDGVTVPCDLVAWLDAARLFKRLGMEERMARAVEHASKLLPYGAVAGNSMMEQDLAANGGDEVFENQNKHSILSDILGLQESADSINGIIAHSFGGNYYESKTD